MQLHRRILALAAILLIFSLGCLCGPAGLLGSSTSTPLPPTITSLPPTEPKPVVSPTEAPTLMPPATPPFFEVHSKLDRTGPWLLIETNQGLWAVNQDGSGLTQLTDVDYWHGDLKWAIQPGGSMIAYLTPADYSLQHLALWTVSLPEGNTARLMELTSPLLESNSNSGPGDPWFEALRAIGERQSFAWSPDGKRLAFTMATDNPSSDLYVFDNTALKITRVSQDAYNDFAPSWSPDGKHLVYLEAKGFGTGAGMVMSAVWVADGDGTHPTKLYDTSSAGEEINGWLDNTTVLLDTWSVYCGPGNLRLLDVVSQQSTLLTDGCVTSAAASSLRQQAMYADNSGLYMLSAEDHTPVKVDATPNAMIQPWGPDDQAFTVRFPNASLATFGMSEFDHQVSPIKAPPSNETMLPFEQTDVSMYGAIWAWTSQIEAEPGAWITGPGIEIGRIFENPARFPAWSPHNSLFFFAPLEGGYDLYRATFDNYYKDLQVVNHLDSDILGVVWLGVK